MSEQPYDILIVGGGFAGLSAALYTARGMKRGILCGAGPSRNVAAAHTHGFLGHDGANPAHLLQTARDQLAPYDFPLREVHVDRITGENNHFTAHLADGTTLQARKIILATGVWDDLPKIPGLQEEWGRSVQHCAYCYGWEVQGQPLALYHEAFEGTEGMKSILYYQKLSRDILVCSDGNLSFTPEQRAFLEERGITLVDSRLERVEGIPTGIRLYFADGTSVERTTLYTHGERKLHSELAQALGCTLSEGGTGIQVEASQATSIPGVYAAGDVSSGNQVAFAVAGGARAAMYAAGSLFYDDLPNLPANDEAPEEAPSA